MCDQCSSRPVRRTDLYLGVLVVPSIFFTLAVIAYASHECNHALQALIAGWVGLLVGAIVLSRGLPK